LKKDVSRLGFDKIKDELRRFEVVYKDTLRIRGTRTNGFEGLRWRDDMTEDVVEVEDE